MKKILTALLAVVACTGLSAVDLDRSEAKFDLYASASVTTGIDFATMDVGIENEANLNIRLPLIDSGTRTTQDQGDFYGWIELRNLSFRFRQANLAGHTLPGNTIPILNNPEGQFGTNVADWLGNKPFVFDSRLVYHPFPYTWKAYVTLFSLVAQNSQPITGTAMSFNKAEAVTTPLFKTYNGVTLLGEVEYEGLKTSGLTFTYEDKKLKTSIKAFTHNETALTERTPSWKDGETDWAFGADFRYDWQKNFLFFDSSFAYDTKDPEQNINAGFAGAVTFPLYWGPVVGFQLAPSTDLRYGLATEEMAFDARINLIGLLSDANKNDEASLLMASLYLGDDRDLEYAVIFNEPLAGGWVDDLEFGFVLSAMDILGNNPKPLPGITQEYGLSSQYSTYIGYQPWPKNVFRLEAQYQTGLAAYFASANEDGLFNADATDRARLILRWSSLKAIPNTIIQAIWTSGNILKTTDPQSMLGILTVQTKVEF